MAGFRADLAAVSRLRRERDDAGLDGPAAASELLTLRHREVMLTGGKPEDLLVLGGEVDTAIDRFPAWPDLRLLRATVALAVHRADLAAAGLPGGAGLVEQPPGRVLAADLAQFTGDYAAARAGCQWAAREDPLWQTTARLAALAVATGDGEQADQLYAAAEEDITAKQMRAFAWVRVQRAELARALDDLDRAGRLLTDADGAHPDWWYVAAHRAALDLARER